MRLKTLEIKGFKSFANETVIHFDEDVIGVVGPNGAGKSNIVDAIRWVLGEQKGKELRLDHMSDVLFNGTKKRKKAGVARVAITFENTKNILPVEYQTVTITRMLYRSGESEYRLNDVACRLKDIRSLLMDTGIGSNSYAIIALGMVDDILQNKENSRRKMFEQAAGIAKYKRRKHETMLKLKGTTADLERVDDLLYEIEGNLKLLEKQARRTKRFGEIKEKYKTQAIDLAVRKSASLNHSYKDLAKQIETEKDILRQHEADVTKQEARLQQIKKDNLDEEKAVSSRQRELNILVGKIRSYESDRGLKEQETLFLEQSVKKLRSQIEQNLVKLEEFTQEINTKAHELQRYAKETEGRKVELDDAEIVKLDHEAAYTEAKTQRDNVTSSQKQVETEYIESEKSYAAQNAQIIQMSGQVSGFKSEIAHVEEELSSKIEERKVLQDRMDQLGKELDKRQENERERKERIEGLQGEINVLKDDKRRKERALDAKMHERDLLKDMVEKLEGYPESIKFLNKSEKWAVKAPLLSDIIYCEAEHRAKVENLLAAHLNDYVVDNVSDAAEAIQLLSASQKGKASFFVLDRMHELRESDRLDIPYAKPLLDFIKSDDKYKLLLGHLFGNAYITEHSPFDDLYKSKDYKHCTFVDEAGGVFVQPDTVSGGSVGLFEGKKLGRAKNLELLGKEIAELESQNSELQEELDVLVMQVQLIQSDDATKEIEELAKQVQKASHTHGQCAVLADRLEDNKVNLAGRHKKTTAAIEQLEAGMSINKQKLEQLKRQIREDASQWKDADARYASLMAQYSESSAAYNQTNLVYVQMKNHVESLEREIKYSSKRKDEVQAQVDHDREQTEQELQTIGQIQGDLGLINDSLIDLYAEKKAEEAELNSAEQIYFEVRNEIQTLDEKIRNKSRERQNSQYLINQLKESHNDIRFKLASVNERLQIEFSTTLDEVLEREIDESVELEELELKVEKLRKRIENYGEINPLALEAFEEMKERFDTITEQKRDIDEAKASLLDTIKEIEETATSQFLESFDRVREYFISVFRSLFTEDDSCDLILEDPENPLESNIQIIAKPKGKRPKSLSQLSGGEKTLTATALLFALYLLKPAPFCIFDEVDAPLDDANIKKFNRIIKKFSEQSQFIVVTHNKQTMSAVDVIYGVYMEEQGVSSLSQVDFRYLEDEALLEAAPA
ncbi:MAG: chromosome segregation protein SMC [Bacteroidetes bacterium]|nr:MAG: chromosome segregation protein SMC [Bacteroidota bacterium]